MIRPIIKDQMFLAAKSSDMTEQDLSVAADLADTLAANRLICAGMAANMIGVLKNCIAFFDRGKLTVMLNPKILRKADPYETEEGCLSLSGMRRTRRFQKITVEYLDTSFQKHTKEYRGVSAQVIQHEIDHCRGIII